MIVKRKTKITKQENFQHKIKTRCGGPLTISLALFAINRKGFSSVEGDKTPKNG